MKLTALIILIACLTASANGFSQITLSEKNAPLQQVLKKIERQSGYEFLCPVDLIQRAGKVSVELQNVTLEEAVKHVLIGKSLTYTIRDRTIVIREAFISQSKSLENESVYPPINVKGRVVNSNGEPITATVSEKGTKNATSTDVNGYFNLTGVDENSTLIITGVTTVPYEIKVNGKTDLGTITVQTRVTEGEEVIINTGYQKVSKERVTGAVDYIDNELLNRRVSTNIIDRIKNLSSGALFVDESSLLPTIRGRNSIMTNNSVLVVLDNFPYDGDLNNINPNDIESVTILKDAAASSIWGARAGNGVIIIKTKKGKTLKPQVSLITNLTFEDRPDIASIPLATSADVIELEKFLFEKGYYDGTLNNTFSYPTVSPVVEVLNKKRLGSISASTAESILQQMKFNDVRSDLNDYFYRVGLKQQYAVNVSGSTPFINYYTSLGWDEVASNLVGSQSRRLTLNSRNIFTVNPRLQIGTGVVFTLHDGLQGSNLGYGIPKLAPYTELVDSSGSGLPTNFFYRTGYIDTLGGGKLLDWSYRPYDEIKHSTTENENRDYLGQLSLNYKFNSFLNAEVLYQYQHGVFDSKTSNTLASYSTRNLINSFTQVNQSGVMSYPVPKGDILDLSSYSFRSHQVRVQLNYQKKIAQHDLSGIAGWELKDWKSAINSYRVYGYNSVGSTVVPAIDYITLFPQYYNRSVSARIINSQMINQTYQRIISFYSNAAYSYKGKYVLSLSMRSDAANLFGVSTNQRGTPLWHTGFAWLIDKEKFYSWNFLSSLKLRSSLGTSGNFNSEASALPTAVYRIIPGNQLLAGTLRNPPNSDLRWEKVRMLNVGIDFVTKSNILSGSFDFYYKRMTDLLGSIPTDPTLGLVAGLGSFAPTVLKNYASMKGHGFDISLASVNIDKKFKWSTNLIFSYTWGEVTDYAIPPPLFGSQLMSLNSTITPIVGKPISTIYSYRWAGLDPTNGSPRGFFGNTVSSNYSTILNNTKVDSMVYNGVSIPPFFGSIRNAFQLGKLSLSINISYKLGYYFRRPSVLYGDFTTGTNLMLHSDHQLRWQKPGDENRTNVPAFVYPFNSLASSFYQQSEILVERGDHIRLEDFQINYNLQKTTHKWLPFKDITLYGYAFLNTLLWKANKSNIDPFFNNKPRIGKRFSLGCNVNF